ncbi:DHA2 family efflux MFS transporter permease subunit [Streptomyces sp. RKND-216]|uniref:MFS transporter n=1 Tax=Streptomyces sp. RKND-216 TaxID=2562581 RepID=UPI00109DD4C6|nr:MFS transporter [Streptomyces sp. RKND-216]THA23578.1 DHA2 family efflux MFS transporter permease subunit [Streptomyces sp. RKND-216]
MDGRGRTWAFAALCAAQFMSMLDLTVVNLALPSIRRDFDAGVSELQWVVGSYVLAFACLLLTGGSLGDRFGRKRVFLTGLAVFTAGSLVSGAAPNLAALVAGRVGQGIGAALFVPATLAILTQLYPEPGERARAIGLWAGVSAVALPLGPVLGGVLVDRFGWPSVFLLNGPVGAAALAASWRSLAETPLVRRRFDLPGQLLGIGWLGCLTYTLIEAEQAGWSSLPIAGLLGAAALLLLGFLTAEHRAVQPMLPLSLFRNRRFAACNAVLFAGAFGLLSSFLFLSLFLQQVQEYPPFQAGLRMLPLLLPAAAAAPVAGRLAARYGPALPMTVGQAATGTALLALTAIGADTPYALWAFALVPLGAGVGLTMTPTNAALMGSVPPEKAGIASATSMVSQQVGNVLGVAVIGAVVAAGFSSALTERAAGLGLSAANTRQLVHDAVEGSLGTGPSADGARGEAVDDSFTAGVHRGFAVSGAAYLTGAALTVIFVAEPRGARSRRERLAAE